MLNDRNNILQVPTIKASELSNGDDYYKMIKQSKDIEKQEKIDTARKLIESKKLRKLK